MTVKHVVEVVYKGRENRNTVAFREFDPATGIETPVDFTNVTRVVIDLVPEAGGTSTQLDTDDTPGIVDWSTAGKLVFDLGDAAVAAGRYYARVTAFDTIGNDTELTHERNPTHRLLFDFVATATIA